MGLTQKTKILVVDDQESFRLILKTGLEKMGAYEVATAHDGDAGLALVRSFRPDVIFLDVMMPGKSGADMASELQENDATANIPIIFITGLVQEKDIDSDSQQIGGREFLVKPFTLDQVVTKIKRVLASHSPGA